MTFKEHWFSILAFSVSIILGGYVIGEEIQSNDYDLKQNDESINPYDSEFWTKRWGTNMQFSQFDFSYGFLESVLKQHPTTIPIQINEGCSVMMSVFKKVELYYGSACNDYDVFYLEKITDRLTEEHNDIISLIDEHCLMRTHCNFPERGS